MNSLRGIAAIVMDVTVDLPNPARAAAEDLGPDSDSVLSITYVATAAPLARARLGVAVRV